MMVLFGVRMTDPSLCDRLGGCVSVCPEEVWKWSTVLGRKLPVPVDQDRCIGCMKCVRICPRNIIEVTPAEAD